MQTVWHRVTPPNETRQFVGCPMAMKSRWLDRYDARFVTIRLELPSNIDTVFTS